VIQEQTVSNPNLTRAQAVRACVAAGVSESTGKRAWDQESDKAQGSKGSEPTLDLEPMADGSGGFKRFTPPLGGDLEP